MQVKSTITVLRYLPIEEIDENTLPQNESIDLDVEIIGEVSSIIPVKTWGHPDSWYPAEGGEVEIISATCVDKEYSDLFKELLPTESIQAKESLIEAFGSFDNDYEPDYEPED